MAISIAETSPTVISNPDKTTVEMLELYLEFDDGVKEERVRVRFSNPKIDKQLMEQMLDGVKKTWLENYELRTTVSRIG